jgi:hypothetical protein
MRICLGAPGLDCQARTEAPRCPRCQALWTQRRRRLYSNNGWAQKSRAARAATPWCSVCGTSQDLTLDHETGTVQCRRCNSAHRGDIGDAKSSAR